MLLPQAAGDKLLQLNHSAPKADKKNQRTQKYFTTTLILFPSGVSLVLYLFSHSNLLKLLIVIYIQI